MYKHFIWDFDGTLFDTYPTMVELLLSMLKEEGHSPNREALMQAMKISMGHAMTHCEQRYGISSDFVTRYHEARKTYDVSHAKPYEEALAVCQHICDRGGFNYLYTHRDGTAIDMLNAHGLLNYFRDCITTENNFARKPAPEALLYLKSKYHLDRSQMLMIGDRDLDIKAGKAALMATCFFDPDGVQNTSADFNVRSLSEVALIIDLK